MANVSHEIRTAMNGVLGMIELLLGETMEPKQHRRVKTLRVSAKALMRVLNDVLDFSKIEAGKLALRPRSVTPVELVWEVVELFRAQAELKGLNISMEVKGSPPGFVHLDPDRLKQRRRSSASAGTAWASGRTTSAPSSFSRASASHASQKPK
jgi:signal transduction histidine kinase